MSAAVNDRPHQVLVPLVHLPLTGELHPLRREFERWLAMGNVITITVAVVVCATIYFWPRPAPVVVEGLAKDFDGVINWSPPPIPTGLNDTGFDVQMPATGPMNIEPVETIDRPENPGTPNTGGGNGPGEPGGETGNFNGTFGIFDSTVVIEPPHAPPYVTPWDDPPVLVSIDAPKYPEMVRDAGIDGTVLVRVFVALNGRVKDAMVVEGASPLHEAALASARTAFFKPALVSGHPVEVWVVIPITFQLRERY